jgi:hypothetical protein
LKSEIKFWDQLIQGDALEKLKLLPDNYIDSVVIDPPSGISFMNRKWDTFKERNDFILFLTEIFKEVYRTGKQGMHCFVWSLPRTSHWTATALENAGFEIRDKFSHMYAPDEKIRSFYETLSQEQVNLFEQILDSADIPYSIEHVFGSGFPKSTSISKQINKKLELEEKNIHEGPKLTTGDTYGKNINANFMQRSINIFPDLESKYRGLGSGIKPSVENWLLVRKPLSEKTLADNVLRWNTGGLNIDASRIGNETITTSGKRNGTGNSLELSHYVSPENFDGNTHNGRWPSHFLLTHHPDCILVGSKKIKGSCDNGKNLKQNGSTFTTKTEYETHGYTDENGFEEVEAWECAENLCPIWILDQQSGKTKSSYSNNEELAIKNAKLPLDRKIKNGFLTSDEGYYGKSYSDIGSASRYFKTFPSPFYYAAKASKSERSKLLQPKQYKLKENLSEEELLYIQKELELYEKSV